MAKAMEQHGSWDYVGDILATARIERIKGPISVNIWGPIGSLVWVPNILASQNLLAFNAWHVLSVAHIAKYMVGDHHFPGTLNGSLKGLHRMVYLRYCPPPSTSWVMTVV